MEVNIMIAGEAGQGVQSAGFILAKALAASARQKGRGTYWVLRPSCLCRDPRRTS